MEKKIVRTTFQFKRSTARKWYQLNPILAQGEPGFEYDTGKLKIGNGTTSWRQLDYLTNDSTTGSSEGIYSDKTVYDFPKIGDENILYRASAEKALYQFNSVTNEYELICKFSEYDDKAIIVDDHLSLSSTNSVQNKVITSVLNDKVDKIEGKQLSTNDFSDEEKVKLASLEKITIDNAIDESSFNPISNNAVAAMFNSFNTKIETLTLDGGEII